VWLLPEVGFTLRGRADRIERRADGRLALLDYKTGVVPKGADVAAGYAAQLPLEAAMAEAGGFGSALQGTAAELTYWRLTGGYIPGEATPVCKGDPALVATETRAAAASLERLVVQFDDPAQAYLSQPHPGAAPRFTDYAQLARVAEWSAVEEAGE
jgi:ATP-dependent helicase/nuclease subunit B